MSSDKTVSLLDVMNGSFGSFEYKASNAEGGGYVPIHKEAPYMLKRTEKKDRITCPYSGVLCNTWEVWEGGERRKDLRCRVIMGHPTTGRGEKEWVIRGYGFFEVSEEGSEKGINAFKTVGEMNAYVASYLGQPEIVPMSGGKDGNVTAWLQDYKTRRKQAEESGEALAKSNVAFDDVE